MVVQVCYSAIDGEINYFYDLYLFILILQLINQLLYTTPSQFDLHVLHGGTGGRQRRLANVVRWRICYLFIYLAWGRYIVNVPLLVSLFIYISVSEK